VAKLVCFQTDEGYVRHFNPESLVNRHWSLVIGHWEVGIMNWQLAIKKG
jgi:hypothetical protein